MAKFSNQAGSRMCCTKAKWSMWGADHRNPEIKDKEELQNVLLSSIHSTSRYVRSACDSSFKHPSCLVLCFTFGHNQVTQNPLHWGHRFLLFDEAV